MPSAEELRNHGMVAAAEVFDLRHVGPHQQQAAAVRFAQQLAAAGIGDVRIVCANGKVFPMSEADMEQKLGRANLARMEANGWAFHQNDPQNPAAYTFVGVSSGGTPVWLHTEVASSEVKLTIGRRLRIVNVLVGR